jgi:hypothetical protein
MVILEYLNLNKRKYFHFAVNENSTLDAKFMQQAGAKLTGAKLTRHLTNDRLRFPLRCS